MKIFKMCIIIMTVSFCRISAKNVEENVGITVKSLRSTSIGEIDHVFTPPPKPTAKRLRTKSRKLHNFS